MQKSGISKVKEIGAKEWLKNFGGIEIEPKDLSMDNIDSFRQIEDIFSALNLLEQRLVREAIRLDRANKDMGGEEKDEAVEMYTEQINKISQDMTKMERYITRIWY